MRSTFDRIIIAVPDLAAAVAQYRHIFGIAAAPVPGSPEVAAAWLGLANTVIELEQGTAERAWVRAIVVNSGVDGSEEHPLDNPLQLAVYQCDGQRTARFRQQQPAAQCADLQVDHLVLRTNDAQACIELFANELGFRLALDRTVPQWGGRMLFFRAGKLTLEVIESTQDPVAESFFWGLAYQCPNIEQAAARLRTAGVELSAVRDGRKPGTRVATVNSHCLELPTLLIEPAR